MRTLYIEIDVIDGPTVPLEMIPFLPVSGGGDHWVRISDQYPGGAIDGDIIEHNLGGKVVARYVDINGDENVGMKFIRDSGSSMTVEFNNPDDLTPVLGWLGFSKYADYDEEP